MSGIVDWKAVGKRLCDLRVEKNVTQEEVAKIMGVTRPAYVRWETASNKPKNKIPELAQYFGVTTDYLLYGNNSVEMTTDNKRIGLRLKSLRKERNLRGEDVAKVIGVKPTTYVRWETGTNSPNRKLVALAKFFNVSTDYLMTGAESLKDEKRNIVRVPVLGRVAAGIPIDAIQEIEGWEEMYKPGAKDGEYFGLHIKGASMEPRMRDGDIVIVRRTEAFESGDTCIVLVNGNEATCKIVQKQANGITLIGYNTAVYPPHFYSSEEVVNLPVKIIGVVVEFRGRP